MWTQKVHYRQCIIGAGAARPALRQSFSFRVDDEHRPLHRRGGFHIRPEGLPLPQASAGDHWSPLQNKSSPCTFMQDELWLGRRGSNSRMRESKSRALPLGDDPVYIRCGGSAVVKEKTVQERA